VPHTLLLADDSVTIQRVIELTFADEDIRVVAVSDGNQAIARVEEHPPDIVLADVGMPGKNGYEVSSYIKHQPRLAHIPVLLLTGAFEPVDQLKASEARCDGVLAKPFEPQLVIGRVKELLGRPRVESVPPGGGAAPGSVPMAVAPADARDASDDHAADAASPLDYFDQLDAAFAKLPAARMSPSAAPGREEGVPTHGAAPTLPEMEAPALPEPEAPALPKTLTPALPRTSAPQASAGPRQPLPALAGAFAALLAVEQNPAAPLDTAGWVPPLAMTDEIIERVAQRVLEKLSDRVVRETVADLVSTVAERLVREEIERIKASIK
jgi:CheY-like chemotaxis protein